MDIFKDLYYINSSTIKKTYNLLLKNWIIIFTGLIYVVLNIVLFSIISIVFRGILGILGGIVTAIATSAMISSYLYLLSLVIKDRKIDFEDFKYGFKVYIWKIYGVLVIGWLSSMVFNLIIVPFFSMFIYRGALQMIISILLVVLLNPLPESIYQKYYSAWDTVVYTFDFIKENWIEWLIPNTLFIIIIYLITGRILTNLFSIYLNFGFNLSIKGIVLFLVGQVIFSFMMIYRGVLFELLSTSTRRKRMFMRNMYK